jgi:hypothetical protein
MPRLSDRPPPKGSLTTSPKSSALDRVLEKGLTPPFVYNQISPFGIKPRHSTSAWDRGLKPCEESPRFQFSYLRLATGKLQN